MEVSLFPLLVTVRLVALCPGEKKMLTGRTDSSCASAARPVRKRTNMAGIAVVSAIRRDKLRVIIETPACKRGYGLIGDGSDNRVGVAARCGILRRRNLAIDGE